VGSWDVFNALPENKEPTGITYCDGHVYTSSDSGAQPIIRYALDAGSLVAVDFFEAEADLGDAEGISCDDVNGLLYIVDGLSERVAVYRTSPGYPLEAVFDVADRAGDPAGIPHDPEGIAFDPVSSHFFLISSSDNRIFGYTEDGVFVRSFDIAGLAPKPKSAQGLSIGPSSSTPGEMSFYIADGGVDNDSDSGERDGSIYEMQIERSGNRLPSLDDVAFTVAEDASPGTAVGTVLASDPDPGDSLTYSIAAGNTGDVFSIHPTTGLISVQQSVLDYETASHLDLLVRAQDDGSPPLFDTARVRMVVLDRNEPPDIRADTFAVDENSPKGTVVGRVVASGPEPADVLQYSIQSGNKGKTFAIAAASGRITVDDTRDLDFETRPVFPLTVRVEDDSGLASTASITVRVTDVNEAPVVEDAFFAVDESSPEGTIVGNVVASDPDAGDTLRFSIRSGDPDDAFAIDATAGSPPFQLTVRARDDGDPRLSSTASVTVGFASANEPPVVSPAAFVLDEHSPKGTVVGTIGASGPEPHRGRHDRGVRPRARRRPELLHHLGQPAQGVRDRRPLRENHGRPELRDRLRDHARLPHDRAGRGRWPACALEHRARRHPAPGRSRPSVASFGSRWTFCTDAYTPPRRRLLPVAGSSLPTGEAKLQSREASAKFTCRNVQVSSSRSRGEAACVIGCVARCC
jgi:hypothetical protein